MVKKRVFNRIIRVSRCFRKETDDVLIVPAKTDIFSICMCEKSIECRPGVNVIGYKEIPGAVDTSALEIEMFCLALRYRHFLTSASNHLTARL